MSTKANWTWLIYMAGDNNLESAGYDDLQELKQVGSTPQVNVIVQFDTEANKTSRFRVEKNRLNTLQDLSGVDCGDPKVLTDFLRWGVEQYPAEHYMVDIWNHGGGWENLPPDFDYNGLRSPLPRVSAPLQRVKRSLFRTTIQNIHKRPGLARAIAIDCGSQNYLDNIELREAVRQAMPNGKKFDILGCDACLMNMLEIGYEMKNTASLMVGSEETEPGAGWPYAQILQKLTDHPQMAPKQLAETIVSEYGIWFVRTGDMATQSALNLDRIDALAQAVDTLAQAMREDITAVAGAVCLARDKAQKFEMPQYVDLGDFVRQLQLRLPAHGPIRQAATQVRLLLQESQDGEGFIVDNVATGPRVRNATGVSIYFPDQQNYAPDYTSLTYSQNGKWRYFLESIFQL